MRIIFIIMILSVGLSIRAGDYINVISGLCTEPLIITCVLLCSSVQSYAQNIVADEVLSDQWTYDNTNAQTICGVVGFVGMFTTYFSSWFFYRKVQKVLADDLRQHKDELERQCLHSEARFNKLKKLNGLMAKKCDDPEIINIPKASTSDEIINIPEDSTSDDD